MNPLKPIDSGSAASSVTGPACVTGASSVAGASSVTGASIVSGASSVVLGKVDPLPYLIRRLRLQDDAQQELREERDAKPENGNRDSVNGIKANGIASIDDPA